MVPGPVLLGALQAIVTSWFPGVAITPFGPSETAKMPGVTGLDGADEGPVPPELLAVTLNVYAVPFANPVTVQDVPLVVQVRPPGNEVTVYVTLPLVPDGAAQLITAVELPAVAVTAVGAPGRGTFGVTELDGADEGPVPAELAAITVNV